MIDPRIKMIIDFSIEMKDEILEEYMKLCDFYNKNRQVLIDSTLDMKNSMDKNDIYTPMFNEAANGLLANIDKDITTFNTLFLLDSIDKINIQINSLPEDIVNNNELVKVFFYNLSYEPDETNGSKIALSSITIHKQNFLDAYVALKN